MLQHKIEIFLKNLSEMSLLYFWKVAGTAARVEVFKNPNFLQQLVGALPECQGETDQDFQRNSANGFWSNL